MLLEAERRRRPDVAARLEPRRDQAVVVVAGDEHDLGVGRAPPPTASSTGRAAASASRSGPVAQLERVAEQHEAVDAVQALQQRAARGGPAQDVDAGARAEVEVGDDEGAHETGQATLRRPCPQPWTASSSRTSPACSPARCAR